MVFQDKNLVQTKKIDAVVDYEPSCVAINNTGEIEIAIACEKVQIFS